MGEIGPDGTTTNDKLLAQDDIDALLGQAGLEGNYTSENPGKQEASLLPKKKSVIKFVKRSDNEVKDLMSMLRNKAFLERESDVNVIWNAQGNVPMVSGSHMKIQDLEYVTLGVLYENHLVVQYKGEKG